MALAKKAKHKKHEEHTDESWLLPYSDLMTLLLALFIVLFASSSADQVKMEKLSEVFNSIFSSGSGVLENPSPITPQNLESNDTIKEQQNSAYVEDQESLAQIKGHVDEFIAVNELESQFATNLTDEGLLVTIRDSVLFAPGKADVNPEYLTTANELAELLVFDPARSVVVTGHTDNVPMNNGEFASNWDLSVMRAVNFLKMVVVQNPNLDPLYFSAKGYGEFRPIATNDTAEGRAQNRRVEILIQPRILEDGTEANSVN